MKKIKILQLPIANTMSGVTQYVLQNLKFIDKTKFQFDVVTRSKALDFENEIKSEGGKIHYLSCSSEENEEQFIKEINVILNEGYDAIHLHTSFWKGYLVEKIAMERACPIVIVHSHTTMVDFIDADKRKEYIAKHNYYRNTIPKEYATNFCACSKDAANWLFGEQIPRGDIQILHNAIDIENYTYSPEDRSIYREKLGIKDCFVLGHVGRFVYQKNHEFLIEIFNELYKDVPNARLMLIGTGELEDKIRVRVKEYGLEKQVLFLGNRKDVPKLLQAMDVFLLPSRFEGLGLVLIEAQAAGLKCFVSKNVPKDAAVTLNIEYVSDSISDWIESIKGTVNGYERINNEELIIQAGYSLRDQIKIIQKLYLGEDISGLCSNAEKE